MIKTLSPYYITIPFVDPISMVVSQSYTLKLYVWDGLKASVPVTATYSITKNNPTASLGSDKLNIARLLNDFIDFMPSTGVATGLINGNNQRWCKVTVTYTVIIADEIVVGSEQSLFTDLVIKGYGYGMEGENPTTPVNRILLTGNEFKVNRTGVFNAPVKILEI